MLSNALFDEAWGDIYRLQIVYHNKANLQQSIISLEEKIWQILCAAFSQRAAALCLAVAANYPIASVTRSTVDALVSAVAGNHFIATISKSAVDAHIPAVAGHVHLFSGR